MFRIGEFSKLSRVPVKTLRYYDEIGLLKPGDIDRFTRYRYYSVDQLAVLNRILVLKDLGFSLDQISRLLAEDLSVDQLRGMLQLRRAEIEQQMETARQQLKRVEMRLKQIEAEGCISRYEVVVKSCAAQWVASVDGFIPAYDQVGTIFDQLFSQLNRFLAIRGMRPSGPGFALYHDSTLTASAEEGIRIEALLPLRAPTEDFMLQDESVRFYNLPEQTSLACVVHQGSLSGLPQAYQAILSWIHANSCHITGPSREIYLRYHRGGESDQSVTEIQFPIQWTKRSEQMQPKIETRPEFMVVGMPYLGKNEHNEISQMWDDFNPRMAEISHISPGAEICFGICSPNSEGLVDYVAALPVTGLSKIPEGMVGKVIPAQTYAVFEAKGLGEIGPTYHYIEKEWLPRSDYRAADGPDFELYPETFDPNDPASPVLIYFPIIQK